MRVLIAEDHPMAGEVICKAAENTFQGHTAVGRVVHSGTELLAALESEGPFDILVQDLYMPGVIQRIELLKAVRDLAPELPILVYTSLDNACVLRACLDAGVRGFVTKRAGWKTFIEAMQSVEAGQIYIEEGVNFTLAAMHPWFDLTPIERDICLRTALGVGTGPLAVALSLTYTTVQTHKANALRKLGLTTDGQLPAYIFAHALDYEFDSDELRKYRHTNCGFS